MSDQPPLHLRVVPWDCRCEVSSLLFAAPRGSHPGPSSAPRGAELLGVPGGITSLAPPSAARRGDESAPGGGTGDRDDAVIQCGPPPRPQPLATTPRQSRARQRTKKDLVASPYHRPQRSAQYASIPSFSAGLEKRHTGRMSNYHAEKHNKPMALLVFLERR